MSSASTNPIASICIPTYNEGNFIGKTLHLLSQQKDFSKCEVIISDYQVNDETVSAVVAHIERNRPYTNNVFYVRAPELGVGKQRDLACRAANPKSIALVSFDADAYFLYPDGLSRLIEPVVNGRRIWTCSPNIAIDERGLEDIPYTDRLGEYVRNEALKLGAGYAPECGLTVSREAYFTVGGYSPVSWAEGEELEHNLLLSYGIQGREVVPGAVTVASARRNLGIHTRSGWAAAPPFPTTFKSFYPF